MIRYLLLRDVVTLTWWAITRRRRAIESAHIAADAAYWRRVRDAVPADYPWPYRAPFGHGETA